MKYVCEVCKTFYSNEIDAKICEAMPITQERGVRIGDIVRITQGDGVGYLGKVNQVHIFGKDSWNDIEYWHTVGVSVKLINHWGSRTLTFDAYETIE